MTERERTLAALRGQAVDQIPWAPRMDLWYIANEARGALPSRFAGLDSVGIAQELGTACHTTGNDRASSVCQEAKRLTCLGLDSHPDKPFRVALEGLPIEQRRDEINEWTTIHTPAGEITAHRVYTPEMRRNGISSPFAKKPPIQSVEDLPAIAEIFERVVVQPAPDGYADYHRRVGDQGLAIAKGPSSASPLHMVFHELTHPQEFFYLYADSLPELRELAEHMTPYYEAALECLATSDAEAVMWGANYDQDLTWPGFFAAEISPWLRKVADRLHAAGKLLITHCDGENEALMELIRDSGADVAESVCPSPMTKQTLREIRARWSPAVAVYGGIPSVMLLADLYSEGDYAVYMDHLFAELGTGERLVLGVADMVPPDADLGRLEDIKRRIQKFGPVIPE